MRSALRGVVFVIALLAFACTAKNPAFCESNADCTDSAAPLCDVDGTFGDKNSCTGEQDRVDASVGAVDAASPADGPVPDACVPATCQSLGALCGPAADGCGGSLECGRCLAAANDGDFVRILRRDGDDLVEVFGGVGGRFAVDVKWSDVDGDGDLDLAVAGGSDPNVVLRNDGSSFALAWEADAPESSLVSAFGDFDGDGDQDWAVGGGGARVYRNDGGEFSQVWSVDGIGSVRDLAFGDVNGDGRADLVLASFGVNRVFVSDGEQLAFSWATAEASNSVAVTTADVDGDGDVDIAVANCGTPGDPEPAQVYRNVGGSFELAWTSPQTDCSTDIAWVTSGALSRLVVTNEVAPVRFFRHVGDAMFAPFENGPGGPSPSNSSVFACAVLDIEGDGDFDYALAVEDGPNLVYERGPAAFELVSTEPGDGFNSLDVAWSVAR